VQACSPSGESGYIEKAKPEAVAPGSGSALRGSVVPGVWADAGVARAATGLRRRRQIEAAVSRRDLRCAVNGEDPS
jgi:hypothetical protein